jgi:hypothetical protein
MDFVDIALWDNEAGTVIYHVDTSTWKIVNHGGAVLHDEAFIIQTAKEIKKESSQYKGQEPPYKPPKRKPGRPRCKDDIWAWEQIFIQKRDTLEVKHEWLEREGVKGRLLVDPERQFTKISKWEWRGEY